MIMLTNFFAELNVLVVFFTTGSGVFNADARRLCGGHTTLPPELSDPTLVYFKPLQEHYGFCEFGENPIRYSDFLKEGVPLMCLTIKDYQGPSAQITPVDNCLPGRLGTSKQRALHSLKSDLDIVSNFMDVIVFRKDQVRK